MKSESPPEGWRDAALARSCLDARLTPLFVLDSEGSIQDGNAAFWGLEDGPRDLLIRAAKSLIDAGGASTSDAEDPIDGRIWRLRAFLLPDGASPSRWGIQAEDHTRDLSPLKTGARDRQLARANTRSLKRLNEELEGFAYSVAHDLRAPLRFVEKFAFLLMEKHGSEFSPEALQYVEQIREASRQTTCLVEDLLRFSQITGQDLHRKTIDMTEIARKVIALSQLDLEDRMVTFQLGDLGEADGDATLVQQVFANLIGNAVKFTRPIEHACIEISGDRTVNPVVYTVADNGVGFDGGEGERIFTVFQRYHQPEEFEGSGVGLAIVKRIVARHGGKAWAESPPDGGARFHFTLAATETGAFDHGR